MYVEILDSPSLQNKTFKHQTVFVLSQEGQVIFCCEQHQWTQHAAAVASLLHRCLHRMSASVLLCGQIHFGCTDSTIQNPCSCVCKTEEKRLDWKASCVNGCKKYTSLNIMGWFYPFALFGYKTPGVLQKLLGDIWIIHNHKPFHTNCG